MKRFCLVVFCLFLNLITIQAQETNTNMYAQQRKQLEKKIQQHPFSKDLVQPQRLPNGKLPPNMYFKQEFLRTMSPETGEVYPEKLTQIKAQIAQGEFSNANGTDDFFMRTPGSQEDPWISRGPFDTGGRTRAIMFDPNDASGKRAFAGGVSGGLWVNDDVTDASSQWEPVSSYWDNNSISCIVSDPNNPQVFYVGTGEVYVNGVAGSGIYKTEDGGESWSHIFDDTFGYINEYTLRGHYFITDIAIRDNNGQSEIFVGVAGRAEDVYLGSYEAGLYKSTDDGNSFERVSDLFYSTSVITGLDVHHNVNSIQIGADNSLWVGTKNDSFSNTAVGGKVFHSVDGTNFDLIYSQNQLGQESGRVELALSHQDANIAYILLENYNVNEPVKILKTTDGGENWVEQPLPVDYDSGIPANDFTRGQSFYDLVIAVDPRNHDHVYVGGIDLFRSVDGAQSWEQISKWNNFNLNVAYAHADQHAIIFNPQDQNQMLFGNDGGVFFAPDNTSFEQTNALNSPIEARNLGYNVTQFYSARLDPLSLTSDESIVGGTQDNGTIILYGQPNAEGILDSSPYTGGDGGQVEFDDEGEYLINGYVYANHYLTNITTGNIFYLLPESERNNGSFINEITLDKNLDVAFVNRGQTTFNVVSGLLGANFPAALDFFTYSISSNDRITKLAVSPYTTTSSTLFVGTINGRLYKVSNANDESNATHVEINTPILGAISEIHFGQSEDHILVTVSNYNVTSIWYTEDGGLTWQDKEGNLPDLPVRTIFMNPNNSNEVVIGTDLGIWYTSNLNDENPTWTTSNTGMSFVKVLEFDYREEDHTLLAATYGRGIFSTENAFLGTNDVTAHRLTDFIVYPQPSKGAVHLLFDKVDQVDVKIYNTLGQIVFEQDNLTSKEAFYPKLPTGNYFLEATHPNGFKKKVNLMMK